MTTDGYWEERGEIIQGPATPARAAECFAAAQASEHSRLEGTLEAGFAFYAFYQQGVGHGIRVRFLRLVDASALPSEL